MLTQLKADRLACELCNMIPHGSRVTSFLRIAIIGLHVDDCSVLTSVVLFERHPAVCSQLIALALRENENKPCDMKFAIAQIPLGPVSP